MKPLKILIIKRATIGDILMSTPLIRQLKLLLKCQLDILVGASAKAVIHNNTYINSQYILADKDFKLGGCVRLIQQLIKMHKVYDYVFILDKHWYFSLMAKFLGTKTIGFSRDGFSQLLLTHAVRYNDINRYQSLYYLDLIRISKLAIPNYADIGLDLTVSKRDKFMVEVLLQKNNIKNFVVVTNSGGNNAYEHSGIRMLPQDKIIQLLDILLKRECSYIILLGGECDVDNYIKYQQILNFPERVVNLAGKLTVTASAYLLSQAQKVYTTDCGIMHMGVAMNIRAKMRVFFGPTNPQHFLPEEYLQDGVALWQDEMIYDPDYQMRGVKNKRQYFQNLNLEKLL